MVNNRKNLSRWIFYWLRVNLEEKKIVDLDRAISNVSFFLNTTILFRRKATFRLNFRTMRIFFLTLNDKSDKWTVIFNFPWSIYKLFFHNLTAKKVIKLINSINFRE